MKGKTLPILGLAAALSLASCDAVIIGGSVLAASNKRAEAERYRADMEYKARIDASRLARGESIATVSFGNIDVNYNAVEQGQRGIRLSPNFVIHNQRGRDTMLNVYFYHENGESLLDRDGLFSTSNGKVAAGGEILTPSWGNASYTDRSVFLPSSQLDLGNPEGNPREYKLKCFVMLQDVNSGRPQTIGRSKWVYFNYKTK
ncbi:hypothetical protein CMI45_03015 [Candidatus Pacearchaeota archaeon]|nr:hypothetical protein [Candidatus Pacearchaeota archaeon]|tara:strand:- start:295 stop:900 length:606 start_codon:yes stop_codon:yes gene_type:complete